MNSRTGNLYAAWRKKQQDTAFLREESPVPPEILLQAIWQHQRIQRGQLQTTRGRGLRVLHPGFSSSEGGPDFRGAILQIDQETPITGDVEVDLQPGGWQAHGHATNPAFKNVILQVVWEEPRKARAPAPHHLEIIALKSFLDSPLAELATALEKESRLPEKLRGKCSAPLRELTGPQLTELLHAAALIRFQNKAAAMLARARHGGWEAALWEHLFRALGYKHNLWPMQQLAEQRPQLTASNHGPASPATLQARLLGVSGLLPDDLTRTQKNSDTFLRHAWDFWWRERDRFADRLLPRTLWKFHGVRPANHPQRRLALAAHWLADERLTAKLEQWILTQVPAGQCLRSLHAILGVDHDAFWSWHWTFRSARLAKPQPLLGETRVTDLAVNVILPWLWIRAKEGGNEAIQREVEQRFFAWPAAEDNSTLKLARQRLLGTSNPRALKGAAAQQGLLQIVRDFCEHSNALCTDCRFPDLVQGFKTSRPNESDAAAP